MVTEEWAKHIINTRFEDLDKEFIANAKNRIIDIVGCTVGGANAPGCSMIKELTAEWGGKQEATILVHGVKAPSPNVACANSIMARSFDYGVLTPYIDGKAVPAHISESTVPTAISMVESKNAGGKELITALILGDDISARVTAASKYAPGITWDSPGIVNKFGTTAIACKLLGLDELQIMNAFGIIIDQLGGSSLGIEDGVHTYKLNQGLASRDGIVAAALAAKGWTGPMEPFQGKLGYFSLFCKDYDLEILTRDLGEVFYADCIFKPYPCCRGLHPAINCALDLVHKYDFKPADIDEVTLNVTAAHSNGPLMHPFSIGVFPQGKALFNLRYITASVILRRSIMLEHLTEEFIRDSEVLEFISKVNVTASLPLEKLMDAAEIVLKMKDGKELSASVEAAKGHPFKNPM
ncbi:MmgE/PrpD family protein, partial [Thermodesulfobacteriota bacterium]